MYEKQALAATQNNEVCTQARSKMTLGAVYQNLGQNRKAIASAEEGQRLAVEVGLPKHELREAFYTLGTAYQSLNMPEKAEEMFQRQLAAARGNIDGECSAERYLAVVYLITGRYSTAIEYFEECLSKANKSGNAALSVHCIAAFEGLGDAYRSLEKPELAREMYGTQLSWAKKNGDSAKEGVASRKLGAVLQQLGRNQEAKEYFESSLVIACKRNALNELWIIYESLGHIHEARGEAEKCAEMRTKGVAAKAQLGLGMKARICGNLGKSLLKHRFPSSMAC